MTIQKAQLQSTDAIREFIFGGNARFTLKSKKTGNHISFRIKKAKDGDAYFISAAKQADEGAGGFNYAGWMKAGETKVRTSAKSNVNLSGARAALDWTLRNVNKAEMPAQLEVWHEGKCCRCGRKLTDPVSVARGIGPECFGKMTKSKVID